MSRIRTIKPEFFTSEDIVSLTPMARLFYVSLWCEADREGRLEWKPRTLKMRYFPGDDIDVVPLGEELCRLGLVDLYEAGGKQYASIPSFKKHQVVNNREAASIIPPKTATRLSRVLTRESGVLGEGKGREGDSVKPHGGSTPELFEDSTDPPDLPDDPPDDPAADPPPPVVTIPLVDGSDYAVTEAQVAEWSTAFPAVAVLQQLRQMRAWCVANPANRKTARGAQAFVVKWLSKAQNHAPRVGDRSDGVVVVHPSSATPDDAIVRRISESRGGEAVQRLPDGRMRCGGRYYRPDGREEMAI